MDTNLGRNRLSEQIEDAILEAIRRGEFSTGQKLPSERTLMEMFNVGRPSVKEALLMLERKGFVRLQRGVAPVVVEPTPQGAMEAISDMVASMLADDARRTEFYDLRVMLEVNAAMEAARNASADDIAVLNEALGACEAAAGQAEPFRDADRAFHGCLITSTGNSVAHAFHGALIDWGLFQPERGPEIHRIHSRVIAQHRDILDAIKAGDQLAAADAVRSHLSAQRNATVPD